MPDQNLDLTSYNLSSGIKTSESVDEFVLKASLSTAEKRIEHLTEVTTCCVV